MAKQALLFLKMHVGYVAFGVLALLLLYAVMPRHQDLRAFDPAVMARQETGMWRDYYEKKYASLFYRLYSIARTQYHASPLDSLRIAASAAQAAHRFQPTHSRAQAQVALPMLVTYYRLLAKGAPVKFDATEAARAELDWWQARREDATAEQYGLTIAHVASLLYGVDNAPMREAGILRAQAMEYRDAHGDVMTARDWDEIDRVLLQSYTSFKRALTAPNFPSSQYTS